MNLINDLIVKASKKIVWVCFLSSSLLIIFNIFSNQAIKPIITTHLAEIFLLFVFSGVFLLCDLLLWGYHILNKKPFCIEIKKAEYGVIRNGKLIQTISVADKLRSYITNANGIPNISFEVDDSMLLNCKKADDPMPGTDKDLYVEMNLTCVLKNKTKFSFPIKSDV